MDNGAAAVGKSAGQSYDYRLSKAFCLSQSAFIRIARTGTELMAKWTVYAKKADFDAIAQQFHIDPVIARIIRNRDIVGDDKIDVFLHGTPILPIC